MQKTVTSIPEALQVLRTTDKWLFYIGPIYDGIVLINIHDFMPTFEMIACHDPYFGTQSFVKVPEALKKAHTQCIAGTDCQKIILRDPQVIAYMKAKDPSPNIVVFLMDQETEDLCKKNGLNIWGANAQVFQYVGNKVKIVDLLQKADIPFIPNVRSKINSFQHLLSLTEKFKSKKICIQAQNGCGGEGTYKVQNEEDYLTHQEELENGREYKIMEYKRLKSFTIDVVITKAGTIFGPLLVDLIGHKELLPFWAGFCGNYMSKSYFQDAQLQKRVRSQIFRYTQKFGNFLLREGIYKGFLGFDFTVDIDTHQVYFQEVNPRLTGTMGIQLQIYEAEGHQFPIYLFHCLEFLGVELNLDIDRINQEWRNLSHYEKNEVSHIIMRPMGEHDANIPYDYPAGFWKQEEGVWKHTGKIDYRINNLQEGQVFHAPCRGVSKANILFKGCCQNFDFQLNQQAVELVKAFNRIRLQAQK